MKPIDIIDQILEKMIFARPEKIQSGVRHHLARFDLSHFSPTFALVPHDDDDVSDFWFLNPEQFDRPDIIWPLDISVCKWSEEDGALELYRTISRKASYFRNRPCRVFPYMATIDCARVSDEIFKASSAIGWAGGKWVNAENGRLIYSDSRDERMERVTSSPEEATQINRTAKMSMSAALTLRYRWCVSFGIDDSPRVKIETDPTGLKALFKERDKEPDRDRRAALRNWVREHWRQRRDDEEATVFVRQHLRGSIPFKWRGLDCLVEPAPFDMELNERLKDARAARA